jgi:site-specific DNA recombinase
MVSSTVQQSQPHRQSSDKRGAICAIYCRVSTGRQEEDGTSLDTQEERCRAFALANGYDINTAHVYREVYTGTELWDRPYLTALREAIRRNLVTHVVAYAIDRLSRDPVHLGVILSEAEHHGVEVEFVTEPLDDTPEGQLIRFVRGYAARVESEKIRERSLRGRRARVVNGKIHGQGIELYGYRRDKVRGIREVYDPEAAVVRDIFRWYVEERLGVRAIAKRLYERGVPTPASGKVLYANPERRPQWSKGQIHRILKHRAYIGETITWRFQRNMSLRPESEWIYLPEGTTPALVSMELWNAAQERLATNLGADARNHKRPYLLRSLVRCAVCQCPMHAMSEHQRYRVYRCASREKLGVGPCGGKRVPAEILEAWAWDQIIELVQHL